MLNLNRLHTKSFPLSSSKDSCASMDTSEEDRKTVRGLSPWGAFSRSLSSRSGRPSTPRFHDENNPIRICPSKGLTRVRSWWNLRSPSERRHSNFSIGSDNSQNQSDVSTPHGSPQLMRTISSTLMEPDTSCRPGSPGWPSKTRELNSAQWDQIYEISLDLIECAWEGHGVFRGFGQSGSWSRTKQVSPHQAREIFEVQWSSSFRLYQKQELVERVLEAKQHACVQIKLPARQEQRDTESHLQLLVQSSHRYETFTLNAAIPQLSWLEELPRKYESPIWEPFLRPHRERNVEAALQDMMGRCTSLYFPRTRESSVAAIAYHFNEPGV